MHYRHFPGNETEIGALGMGCMRLPTLGGSPQNVDQEAALATLDAAIEAGVTYFDTAWPYHGGTSEVILGEFLRSRGLRERVTVATKCPVWLVKSEADWERFLSEQLVRLGTDHIDYYLFHALSADRWQTVLRLGGLRAFERFLAEGRIRHIGFSFHDSHEAFRSIIDGYDHWDMCQVQYNYMDTDYQAGEAGIAYAASRHIGVVAMEPLRGGALVNAPKVVREIFAEYPVPRLPLEWALRFVLERQEIVTVLSGMGSPSQVWENAGIASAARPNSMTKKELDLVARAREIYLERQKVPCTACGYCKPCPSGIQIPDVLGMYNAAAMYDTRESARRGYTMFHLDRKTGADVCTRCGACIPKCPQSIPIPDALAEAHSYLLGS